MLKNGKNLGFECINLYAVYFVVVIMIDIIAPTRSYYVYVATWHLATSSRALYIIICIHSASVCIQARINATRLSCGLFCFLLLFLIFFCYSHFYACMRAPRRSILHTHSWSFFIFMRWLSTGKCEVEIIDCGEIIYVIYFWIGT